jgi:hypothetical protein
VAPKKRRRWRIAALGGKIAWCVVETGSLPERGAYERRKQGSNRMSDDGMNDLRQRRASLVFEINFGEGQIKQWQNLIDLGRQQQARFEAQIQAIDAQLAKAAPTPGS